MVHSAPRRVLGTALVLAIAGVGCQAILGIEPWGATEGAGGGSASTSSTSSVGGATSTSASSSSVTSGATSSSSTGGGCTTVGSPTACGPAQLTCFGGECCDGQCTVGTVSLGVLNASKVHVAATSTGQIAAATNQFGFSIAETLAPSATQRLMASSEILQLAADSTEGYALDMGHITRFSLLASSTAVLTSGGMDPNIGPQATRLRVVHFAGPMGSVEVCFLRSDGMGNGGGLYCQSPDDEGVAQRTALDFPIGLASDPVTVATPNGGQAFVAYQGQTFYGIQQNKQQNALFSIFGFLVDVAVDPDQIFWIDSNEQIYAQTKGTTLTATGVPLSGAKRIVEHGSYVYVGTQELIFRAPKANPTTFDAVIPAESAGMITDFDVDDHGIYWGVVTSSGSALVRMRGLSSN
ncbi:MAG: hypothetical protein U0414_24740 [Polyangiaceae bacterium]